MKYEMRTLSKVVFSEVDRFVYRHIKIKIYGMISQILCYAPPFVELLGPATPLHESPSQNSHP